MLDPSGLNLTKTTEDGKNLAGWQFGIYSDSACTTLISGPHTTDSNGKISVADLSAGTVYVKELGHTDSSIHALYTCSGENPQKVLLTAGQTATVSFHNVLNTGSVKLVKETNTGENLAGWQIGLYYDADCTQPIDGSPFVTGADGTITVRGLEPGTLYAKEIPTDDPYWEFDTEVKKVTIAVNQTATVTFTNTHYGRIEFRKTTNTGNHLGGWTFRVKDSNYELVGEYTTDENGYGFFTATYNTSTAGESVMTINFTERGLAEINASKAVYSNASNVNSGFSDCTLRITYTAKMDSDNSVVFGDAGNPNDVVMVWKRTSDNYYDTLVDDCHVYTYGIDLTKMFSDGKGDFSNVQFIVQNDTDGYYVKAELNEAEGIYYVVDHVVNPDEATRFIPVESNGNPGKVIIKGLEDDTYTVTEIRTDNGYTLLKDDIEIVLSQKETTELCDIYESDVLGLIQNDPRYATIINDTGDLKNMPQVRLEHHLLTASATVDGNAVNMLEDNGSVNAEAPLTVVNTRGFDLPETGDHGTMIFTVLGIVAMAGAATVIVLTSKKKNGSR